MHACFPPLLRRCAVFREAPPRPAVSCCGGGKRARWRRCHVVGEERERGGGGVMLWGRKESEVAAVSCCGGGKRARWRRLLWLGATAYPCVFLLPNCGCINKFKKTPPPPRRCLLPSRRGQKRSIFHERIPVANIFVRHRDSNSHGRLQQVGQLAALRR